MIIRSKKVSYIKHSCKDENTATPLYNIHAACVTVILTHSMDLILYVYFYQIKIWFQNRRAKERRQRRKAEVEQDHVMNEEQENESPDSPRSDDISNYPTVSPDVTHFSPLNYADGQLFGETTTKSQCRYQQNIPGVSCTSPVFYQRQSDSCSTSPSDWSQKGVSLTKYDVSPFAANPDWTLVYRS